MAREIWTPCEFSPAREECLRTRVPVDPDVDMRWGRCPECGADCIADPLYIETTPEDLPEEFTGYPIERVNAILTDHTDLAADSVAAAQGETKQWIGLRIAYNVIIDATDRDEIPDLTVRNFLNRYIMDSGSPATVTTEVSTGGP